MKLASFINFHIFKFLKELSVSKYVQKSVVQNNVMQATIREMQICQSHPSSQSKILHKPTGICFTLPFFIYLFLGLKIDLKRLFIHFFFGSIFHVYILKAFLGMVAPAGKARESKFLVARPSSKILLQLVLVQPSLKSTCKLVSNSHFQRLFPGYYLIIFMENMQEHRLHVCIKLKLRFSAHL